MIIEDEESLSKIIIDFHQNYIHPMNSNWLENINMIIDNYLIQETRERLRKDTIEIINKIMNEYTIYIDEILENILFKFEIFYESNEHDIVKRIMSLLYNLIKNNNLKKFEKICLMINKFNKNSKQISNHCVEIFIDLFKIKFNVLPCSESTILFNLLMKSIKSKDSEIRNKVLTCLLSIKANKNFELLLDGKCSQYLKSHLNYEFRSLSSILPISNLIDNVISNLFDEDNIEIIVLSFIGKNFLNNYFFIIY
jgi:hypothetical protein